MRLTYRHNLKEIVATDLKSAQETFPGGTWNVSVRIDDNMQMVIVAEEVVEEEPE